MSQPIVKYKDDVPASAAIISTIFGVLMGVLVLVDFSIISYILETRNISLASSYFAWKIDAPIIQYFILFIKCLVPLALLQVVANFFFVFTRKATVVRHIVDVVNTVLIFGVIFNISTNIDPLENSIREAVGNFADATLQGDEPGLQAARSILDLVQELYYPTLINLVSQVALISFPLIRFGESGKLPIPEEVAQKKKD